jgi:hypothetical protein
MKHGRVYWVLFCLVAWVVVVYIIGHDRKYSGTDVTVTTSAWDQIEVTAKKTANVEAASGEFFMLTHPDGETLFGHPEKSPLGWSKSKYIVLKPTQISVSGGKWDVEVGSDLILHFTTDGNLNVVTSLKPSSLVLLRFAAAGIIFILWLAGFVGTHGYEKVTEVPETPLA